VFAVSVISENLSQKDVVKIAQHFSAEILNPYEEESRRDE
jgi:hypothetical protein